MLSDEFNYTDKHKIKFNHEFADYYDNYYDHVSIFICNHFIYTKKDN